MTTMEQQFRAKCEQILNQDVTACNTPTSLQALSLARSLIVNPSTSEATISSLLEILSRSLRPDRDALSLQRTLSLLSELAAHRPHLSHPIFHAIRSFSLLCDHNSSSRTLTAALSVLVSIAESDGSLLSAFGEFSEGLFLSLCFRPSVSARHWLLLNAERFRVRPHLLLTVFLGFTKDPYPHVRRVALDGLVGLCESVVVEDPALVEGCYCRAVELLCDMDDSVRSAAVRAVTKWGQLLVALNHDHNRRDCSNALFLQLCSMVRDMSVKVRVGAIDALGEIGMVSEDILLQTLSKKVLSINKEKTFPGLCSTKPFEMVSSAAGAFVHGLEDEFREVRRSACHSLHTLSILSADFAGEALNLLMDVLNDDSMAVRLQALETMRCMALFGHLNVKEAHMHMFLSTLVDSNALVRSAARKVLRVTKLKDMAIFKLSIDGLLENLEMYPQDDSDVFSVLFDIGRYHGKFAADIIEGASDEIEPTPDGKFRFDSGRVAALLVLAISAPLSHEECACRIPPRMFSYAVTMLGKISHALSDVMDQNTLLAYLSSCSRSTANSTAELFLKKKEPFVVAEDNTPNNSSTEIFSPSEMQLQPLKDGTSKVQSLRTKGLGKVSKAPADFRVQEHDAMTVSVELILEKVKDIWQLIKQGCTDEVIQTLRSWQEELATFTTCSSPGGLAFVLQYLRVVKLLAKIWLHFVSPRKLCSYGKGELSLLIGKLDRSLREMRYRFIGLSKQEELHILELVLLNCILRLSSVEVYFDRITLGKLYSILSQAESLHKEVSVEPSNFVIELKKALHESRFSSDGPFYCPVLFQKVVELFALKQFVFCREAKHIKAELDVHDNNFENPFRFISGLPIGVPVEITLYNVSRENRLWLHLSVDEALTEFIFLDLDRIGGSNQIRKLTFIAPFYKTPRVNCFTMRVYLGMECLSEDPQSFNNFGGPKPELVYLCKEKEVFYSASVND